MSVLITGGAGFIGSNLVKKFINEGHDQDIRVLDDLSTGNIDNLNNLNVDFVEGSILDEAALRGAVRGVDSIVHLAAVPSVPRSIKDPKASHDANATGTINVLETAKSNGVNHVTVASSSSVYGSNPSTPKNEKDWVSPMSPYAASKLATEGYALAYGRSYGMATMAFRFFNVFGPGQAANHAYAAVIPKFIDSALRGSPLPLDGTGEQSRDFTYVGTVCAALYETSIGKLSYDRPVNLAFGTSTTLNELISIISDEVGRPLDVERRDPRIGDVFASQADGELVRELFPNIDPVDLRTGIKETVSWFGSI